MGHGSVFAFCMRMDTRDAQPSHVQSSSCFAEPSCEESKQPPASNMTDKMRHSGSKVESFLNSDERL